MKIGQAILAAVVLCAWQAHGHLLRHGRPKGGMLRDPVVEKGIPVPPAQWFEQQLDHFDGQNMATWKQRFFVNSTFYKPGGPVFLQIGGEGTANPVWVVVGQMMVDAAVHGAMAILVEHRYYGESHPTPDLELQHMRYLSSEQALADLANFRDQYGSAHGLEDAKWVTFGGSYPGALSSWARLKYPHFFHAAIASSAPVHAAVDFNQYLEVVQASILADGGKDCLDAIRMGAAEVNEMLTSASGRTLLEKTFKTCSPIPDEPLEISSFSQGIAGLFMGVVQYNRDNVAFEGRSEVTITDVCAIMTNKSVTSMIERLAGVNRLLLKEGGDAGGCFDASYKDSIVALRNTTYAAAEGGRQWFYQVCHEFGYLQGSESNATAQPFGNLFPLSTQVQQCIDVFNVSGAELAEHVAWSNQNYGSLAVKGSRIVFPNGNIDPWHALSVLPTTPGITHDNYVVPVLIDGTAHCANMYPSSTTDLSSLVNARHAIATYLKLFLTMED